MAWVRIVVPLPEIYHNSPKYGHLPTVNMQWESLCCPPLSLRGFTVSFSHSGSTIRFVTPVHCTSIRSPFPLLSLACATNYYLTLGTCQPCPANSSRPFSMDQMSCMCDNNRATTSGDQTTTVDECNGEPVPCTCTCMHSTLLPYLFE